MDWITAHGREHPGLDPDELRGPHRLHIAPALGGIRLARLQPRDVRRLVDGLVAKGQN